jgi:hypothetical protein
LRLSTAIAMCSMRLIFMGFSFLEADPEIG